MSPKSDHKSKYRVKNFSYSNSGSGQERNIPGGIKLIVLFNGAIQFIGIVFTVSGLGFLIPALMGGIPFQFALVPAVFPVIGLSFLFFTLRKRIKYLRIIKTGKFTYGTYVRSEPTNVKINNATVYRHYFSFTDSSGTVYTASGDTHTGNLTDEERELLVYNPNDPDEAVLIDIFPFSVKKQMMKIIEDEEREDVISDY